MAVSVPVEVQTLFKVVVGEEWPTGNEDSVRKLAAMWGDVAASLKGVGDLVDAARDQLAKAGNADGIRSSVTWLEELSQNVSQNVSSSANSGVEEVLNPTRLKPGRKSAERTVVKLGGNPRNSN